MSQVIIAEPLTVHAFSPFGEILDALGEPDEIINQGNCGRFDDRATIDMTDGRAGISLFKAAPRTLPYTLDMVERHPLGSQAFVPMSQDPFLVTVAPNEGREPGRPRAFVTVPGQGVNLFRGTWHGVLTPLHPPGLFAVIDRIGDGENLERYWFEQSFVVESREQTGGD